LTALPRIVGVQRLNLLLLFGSERRTGLFHDQLQSREATAFSDLIVSELLESSLLIGFKNGVDLRDQVIIDSTQLRGQSIVRSEPAAGAASSRATFSTFSTLTPLASFATTGTRRLRAEALRGILSLFQRGFNLRFQVLFLVAAEFDVCLCQERLDLIHGIQRIDPREDLRLVAASTAGAISWAFVILCEHGYGDEKCYQ
jgi:hypothetical protein